MARVIFACVVTACSEGASSEVQKPLRTSTNEPARAEVQGLPPDLRIAVVSDLGGVLEPCGCTSRPAGGVDRLAAALSSLRHDEIPVLAVASGATFVPVDGSAQRTAPREQDRWATQVLSAVLSHMELGVLAPSPEDFVWASSELQGLARVGKRSVLAPRGTQPMESTRSSALHTAGSYRVGLTSEPSAAEVARLREEGAALVIAFEHDEKVREGKVSGADMTLRTGATTLDRGARMEGETIVISGGRHGEGLLVIDVWLNENPQGIRLLSAPPTHDASRSQRLARIQVRALDQNAPRDPVVRALLEQLFARIHAHNAQAQVAPKALAKGKVGYVGARTCAACHTQAYYAWRQTSHARAFDTLTARGRSLDLDCIGCHVTGYEQPGGATLSNLDELKGVGCESCHGPGSAHVDNPRGARDNVRRSSDRAVCIACHDGEHSDRFDYDSARAALLIAGHGLVVGGESGRD